MGADEHRGILSSALVVFHDMGSSGTRGSVLATQRIPGEPIIPENAKQETRRDPNRLSKTGSVRWDGETIDRDVRQIIQSHTALFPIASCSNKALNRNSHRIALQI